MIWEVGSEICWLRASIESFVKGYEVGCGAMEINRIVNQRVRYSVTYPDIYLSVSPFRRHKTEESTNDIEN